MGLEAYSPRSRAFHDREIAEVLSRHTSEPVNKGCAVRLSIDDGVGGDQG